jgi:chromate transporter
MPDESPQQSAQRTSVPDIFLLFLRLGCTSFGGPIAHLGYFRREFVERRHWLDDHAYAELVAVCQFLPGPTSSEVGIALGLSRRGVLGALAAWLGFTLPSALLLMLLAIELPAFAGGAQAGILHGLRVVAVAVVAQAVFAMARRLTPDLPRALLGAAAAVFAVFVPSFSGQIGALACGALAGALALRHAGELPHADFRSPLRARTGAAIIAAHLCVLGLLAYAGERAASYPLALFAKFFCAGSLVFGGGHVVLPLLHAQVVPRGWVSHDIFLAGYGLAQAVPGPLFTFAAWLGAASSMHPSGCLGGAIALAAIFLPSFLLVFGVLPIWERLRTRPAVKRAVVGANAAVVGLLAGALIQLLRAGTIASLSDALLAAGAIILLVAAKAPSWSVVILGAVFAAITY